MSLVLLPLLLPLVAAALLLTAARLLPPSGPDAIAVAVAAASAAASGLLAARALGQPIAYWFGGWNLVDGAAIGIGFVVDPAGAVVSAFAAFLFLASFAFGWNYFDEARARYYVLMLIFLAAIVGFCLTGDIFNMFVFFELMSVAAFAVTAYRLEASGIEGALNFTIMTMIGSFLFLGGIGMLYGRTGALNLAQIGRAVAASPDEAAFVMAFVLLLAGLLIKAAIVPFHFWLADAHAVAPSPVCVIFSGIMVPVALFGVGRIYWTVFASGGAAAGLARGLLVDLGVASALLAGCTCLMQRHIKRLLAFSTVSHMGIMLAGLASLNPGGTAGFLLYLLGHGLVKGALFMLAGILMSRYGAVDELALRGRGRDFPLGGIAFALAGLLLAGLPLGPMADGHGLIGEAVKNRAGWIAPVLALGAALTGGAVLRVTGRVFLGLGESPGQEAGSDTKAEGEKQRPSGLLFVPAAALLLAAVVLSLAPVGDLARRAAGFYMDRAAYAAFILDGSPVALRPVPAVEGSSVLGWCGAAVALVLAAFELNRDRLPRIVVKAADAPFVPVLLLLNRIHTGRIGDYAVWALFGLTLFGVYPAF